jgi:hypothetical protein
LKTWKLPLGLHRHCVLRSLVMAMAVADLTEVAKKRTQEPVREGGGPGMPTPSVTPVTPQQIDSLGKLMKILKDDTKRAQFKSAPDDTADAAGVDRSLPGIQDTITELADKNKWSLAELKMLAELNDKMLPKLPENPASTTLKLAKQV